MPPLEALELSPTILTTLRYTSLSDTLVVSRSIRKGYLSRYWQTKYQIIALTWVIFMENLIHCIMPCVESSACFIRII